MAHILMATLNDQVSHHAAGSKRQKFGNKIVLPLQKGDFSDIFKYTKPTFDSNLISHCTIHQVQIIYIFYFLFFFIDFLISSTVIQDVGVAALRPPRVPPGCCAPPRPGPKP